MDLKDIMTGQNNTKRIETGQFTVEGNIVCWKDTIIPINNVSMISISKLAPPVFPKNMMILLIVGLLFLSESDFFDVWIFKLVGILFVFFGGWAIYKWAMETARVTNLKSLNFVLNSGSTYSLVFENVEFLKDVHQRLAQIIAKAAYNEYYNFDITNNQIDHNIFSGQIDINQNGGN